MIFFPSRYPGDQNNTERVHHPRLPGQVDADHQGGGPDTLRVLGPVARQGRAYGAHC